MHSTDLSAYLERRMQDHENPHSGSFAIALALMHVAEAIEDASIHTGTCITDAANAIIGLANATLKG